MNEYRHVATRLACFAVISAVETDLRQIIAGISTQKLLKEIVPEDVREKTEKRVEYDVSSGGCNVVEDDLDYLEYADFSDLSKVLHLVSSHLENPEKKFLIDVANKIEALTRCRNRVCHSRPLEAEDFPSLMDLGKWLVGTSVFPFLGLRETLRMLGENPSFVLTLSIPEFWSADVKSIQHNLPLPDFDDTGFLGRLKDRRTVNKHFTSAHPVITIVGEGGIGKTALALRCLYDLLELDSNPFDAIIWISLKTRSLSATGIKEISGVITSALGIIKQVSGHLGESDTEKSYDDALKDILESMSVFKILLAIDNFETLSNGNLRPFLEAIPPGSKVLLTSRIGLGEMEIRYPLDPLDEKAALTLMRVYSNSLNLKVISAAEDVRVKSYCKTLYNNPLLIKWFVGAVSLGADPNALLNKSGKDFSSVIQFCFQNLYERLTQDEKNLLWVLYSARRPLTHAEIYYLTKEEHHDRVELALGTLNHSSMLKRTARTEGSSINYALTDIASEYITKYAKPEHKIVLQIQESLRKLKALAEVFVAKNQPGRYNRNIIQCTTNDEVVCAGYLRKALQANEYVAAKREVDRAKSILPNYSENYRIAASIESAEDHIYQADDEYRQAVSLSPKSAFTRYEYALFLLNCMGDAGLSLEQLEAGLKDNPDDQSLQSLKALSLVRLGRYSEAAPIYAVVMEKLKGKPKYQRCSTRDQYAECYRRWMELDSRSGDVVGMAEHLSFALSILHDAFVSGEFDAHTIEVRLYKVIKEAAIFAIRHTDENIGQIIVSYLNEHQSYFDAIKVPFPVYAEFNSAIKCAVKLSKDVIRPVSIDIRESSVVPKPETRGYGVIRRILKGNGYGFIFGDDGREIFFHRNSLAEPKVWDALTEGNRVNFLVSRKVKGWAASSVSLSSGEK